METRLIVAYLLIALMAAALAAGLWRFLTRERRRHQHYLAGQARRRHSPPAAAPAPTPSDADR